MARDYLKRPSSLIPQRSRCCTHLNTKAGMNLASMPTPAVSPKTTRGLVSRTQSASGRPNTSPPPWVTLRKGGLSIGPSLGPAGGSPEGEPALRREVSTSDWLLRGPLALGRVFRRWMCASVSYPWRGAELLALDGLLEGPNMLLTFSYARLDIWAANPVAADAAESSVATTDDVFE